MAYDAQLAERIQSALARKRGIVAKKMFGAIGYMLNGHVLVGIWKDALIARLPLDDYVDALREPHVREFNVTGKSMKGWVLVDPPALATDAALADWIDRALRFVRTLPAK